MVAAIIEEDYWLAVELAGIIYLVLFAFPRRVT